MADIKYVITADAAGAVKGIKAVDGSVDNLQRSATKAKPKLKSMFGQIAIGAGVAIAARAAIRGMVRWMGDAIAAAAEQERVERALNAVLESTGHAAGLSADELKRLARELQGVTTYGDEAIIAGNNILLTFKNIGEDVFPRATESMLNISTAMGIDLKSSAIQVGKALNDPITGLTMLTRIGITFTDSQKEMIKQLAKSGDLMGAQGIILEELESQFGGAARAAADTFGGSLTQLKNVYGDLQEEVGRAITESEDFREIIKDINLIITEMVESGMAAEWANTLADSYKLLGTVASNMAYILRVMSARAKYNIEKQKELAEAADTLRWALEWVDIGLQKIGVDIFKLIPGISRAEKRTHELNEEIDTQIKLLDTWMPKARNMKDWAEDMATTLGTTTIPAMNNLAGVIYNIQPALKDAYDEGFKPFETDSRGSMERVESWWGQMADGLQTKWASTIGEVLRGAKSLEDGLKGIWDAILVQFTDMIGAMIAKWLTNFVGSLVQGTATAASKVVGSLQDMASSALNLAAGFSPGGMIATAIGTAVGTFLGSLLGPKGAGERDTQLIKDNTWMTQARLENVVANLGDIKWSGWNNEERLQNIMLTLWDQTEMMRGGLGASAGIPAVAGDSGGGGSAPFSFNPTMSLTLKPIHIHLTSILELDGREAARAIGKHTVPLSKGGHFKIHERGIVSG